MTSTQTSIAPVPSTVQQQITQLRTELRGAFLERTGVIDGALCALIAGEHILLLGPPGTAKSALARTLCNAIDGATYFERLLMKTSVPEEVFGPYKLSGLKQDIFERKIDRKLPDSHIAFIDEIFKCNSTLLNGFLKILNEREFDNDTVVNVPLLSMFGASNELPESKDLEALFDRFLFRFWINYIGDRANLRTMLSAGEPAVSVKLSLADLETAQVEAARIPISEPVMEVMLDVKEATERAGVRASDRRWRSVMKALRAFAYLLGDSEVNEDHFDLMPDMLWREPSERSALAQEVGKVANPMAAKAIEILDSAREVVANLPGDEESKATQLAAMAEANAQLEAMGNELGELVVGNPSKARRLKEALEDVRQLHEGVQRKAAKAAGIKI